MLLMHARRFYEVSVLGYVQDTETVYIDKGRPLKPNKDALKERPDVDGTRPFILDTTLRAGDEGINLGHRFKQFVDGRFKPVTDDALHRKTA